MLPPSFHMPSSSPANLSAEITQFPDEFPGHKLKQLIHFMLNFQKGRKNFLAEVQAKGNLASSCRKGAGKCKMLLLKPHISLTRYSG